MALRRLKALPKPAPVRKVDAPKAPHVHDESNWLVSYADMMTLLCGFFIMMFSMASLDEPKYESMKEAVAKQFGGTYKSPTEDIAKFLTQKMDQEGILKEALIQSDVFGVTVGFKSTLFFETLSSEIKPEGIDVLNKLITAVQASQQADGNQHRIVVEGHTDSRPITGGPYPSNWELSGSRASSVVRVFLDHGFAPDHMTAIGYADTYPLEPSSAADGTLDEAALAKNRRVVIRILLPKVDSIPFPQAAPPANSLTPAADGHFMPVDATAPHWDP